MQWPWQHDRDDDLIAALARFLDESPHAVERRTLASASGSEESVVALREAVAVRQPDSQWRVLQWPEVRSGAWDGETNRLTITTLDGNTLALHVNDPGRLPAVFFERVQATILVEERVRVPGGEVVVSGRRQPAGVVTGSEEAAVVWHAMAIGPVDLNDPAVSRLVVAATERLRADYEL